MRHLIISLVAVAALSAADTSSITFAKIKPLLDSRCVECHGAKKAKHDFRADSVEAVFKGGKKMGAGVIAGKPDESPLVQVLTMPRSEKLAMPPQDQGEAFTAAEIALVKKWITDGAKP